MRMNFIELENLSLQENLKSTVHINLLHRPVSCRQKSSMKRTSEWSDGRFDEGFIRKV